jgi:hypothetical protein
MESLVLVIKRVWANLYVDNYFSFPGPVGVYVLITDPLCIIICMYKYDTVCCL